MTAIELVGPFAPEPDGAEPSPADAAIVSGQLRIEFGFKMQVDVSALEAVAALFANAAVEPDLDRRLAEERCPGCRQLFAEVPFGHAWSYDTGTREYRCSDPPYPGGPAEFTADTHPDRQWADTGWEKVQVMLRECDDAPVVLSYSVEDDFPGPGIANWQPPPMPDGWAPDWAASEQGAVEWERDYPSAEDRLTCYREQAGDLWYELPFAQQWRMAMAGLRRERPWARLAPGTLTKYTFELGVSVYDWYAPDRDQRIQAAAAAAERDDT